MTETAFRPGRKGLELDAPEAGDVVTVRVRPPSAPQRAMAGAGSPVEGLMRAYGLGDGRDYPEWESPQHYRHTSFWRVLAVNGGHAVVRQLAGYDDGRVETWPVFAHLWFEASELWEAYGRGALAKAERDLADAEASGYATQAAEKRRAVERCRTALAATEDPPGGP